jgi:hypothetical protein
MNQIDELFTEIAREHLCIETLETRNLDSLDFHDVSVAGVKNALLAAYRAGSPEAAPPIVVVTVRGGLIEDVDATMPAHVVVEDWDIPEWDAGKKPTRNVWKLNASLTARKAEQLRRLIANY